ncbi:ABC transporter ATP-binding protein [Deinococcus marmoris]|uniref:Mannoside ABC transport system, ATP-binding protein 2 n=1 Tax=Deinococcus marmoris TaxID=249408 RepID=A0A1U7NWP7_9DEIO|nr:ATP-binding cassette domain-containing protein [Deinococcus marmoris]OLV17339.1 Mannoside ABC transport system, ATP-binding protein 2 [Deinococcus marmoris]
MTGPQIDEVTASNPFSDSGTPLLEFAGVSRVFGSVTAVKDVSFQIAPGQIVALVGESGSGKTTLARLAMRLLLPTSGEIRLEGEPVGKHSQRAYWRTVQAAFQDPSASFNQFYTVRRLLRTSLGVLDQKLSRDELETRMAEALTQVGIPPAMLDKRPHELSGGQRQRVMIARALMLRPRLLVADEPTSMLDASLRVSLLNLLRDLRDQQGLSILLITHDLGQAYYVSDRLLVMYRGELVEQGETEAVVAERRHPYTQQLLADVPKLH